MDNAGVYNLVALPITAALSGARQSPITGLAGMGAVTLEAELLGGTGGTSLNVTIKTSLDGGSTLRDIARFDFTTAAKKFCNLQANAAKGITLYAALGAEGVNDGLLGDYLVAEINSVGTYVDTTLAVRASVRG